jgi:HK97 family phage prohead protease
MRQHPEGYPVFTRHNYSEDPLGNVVFHRSAEGTMFEATLSRTYEADQKLVLVNDKVLNSVSVGFRPHHHVLRTTPDGNLVYRTEVAYRELSLAPTGFGAYEDALVSAVRTEDLDTEHIGRLRTPVLDALHRRRSRLSL